jgi:hypothetical protein
VPYTATMQLFTIASAAALKTSAAAAMQLLYLLK